MPKRRPNDNLRVVGCFTTCKRIKVKTDSSENREIRAKTHGASHGHRIVIETRSKPTESRRKLFAKQRELQNSKVSSLRGETGSV